VIRDQRKRIGNISFNSPLLIPFCFKIVLTSITSLLDVETIGNKEEIRMNELDGLRSELFNPVAGGENEFNPALITAISNVVLNGSSDHTFANLTYLFYLSFFEYFAEQATIDELVQDALFHWHVSTTQYLLY